MDDDCLRWDTVGCPITIWLGPPPHDLPRGEILCGGTVVLSADILTSPVATPGASSISKFGRFGLLAASCFECLDIDLAPRTARVARVDDCLRWDTVGCPIKIWLGPPPHDLPRGELRVLLESVFGVLESRSLSLRDALMTRLRLFGTEPAPRTTWLGPPPHELVGSSGILWPASTRSCKRGFDVFSSADVALRALGGKGASVCLCMTRLRALMRGSKGGKPRSCW